MNLTPLPHPKYENKRKIPREFREFLSASVCLCVRLALHKKDVGSCLDAARRALHQRRYSTDSCGIYFLAMRCLAILQLAALAAYGVQAKTGHGFVGYGIRFENPACAFACRESISGAILQCSITDMGNMEGMSGMDDMSGGPMTDPECYATDDAFLRTLALCISTRCSSVSVWRLEQFWKGNVAGSDDTQPDPKETYQQTLAKIYRTPTVEYSGTGWLNQTSIVPYDLWFANYNTDVAFGEQESQQEKYGQVIRF